MDRHAGQKRSIKGCFLLLALPLWGLLAERLAEPGPEAFFSSKEKQNSRMDRHAGRQRRGPSKESSFFLSCPAEAYLQSGWRNQGQKHSSLRKRSRTVVWTVT